MEIVISIPTTHTFHAKEKNCEQFLKLTENIHNPHYIPPLFPIIG